MKILYKDKISDLDFSYLPVVKQTTNGKYVQLCTTIISEEVIEEILISNNLVKICKEHNKNIEVINSFLENIIKLHNSAFNVLSKKMNFKYVSDEESKKLIKVLAELFQNKNCLI